MFITRFLKITFGLCILLFDSYAQFPSTCAVFADDFSGFANGWILGPEWQIGPTISSGICSSNCTGADPATDHSPGNNNGVAGVLIGGCTGGALHGFYYLTSPVVNLATVSGSVYLDYWRSLHSDYPSYMTNVVQAFNGTAWVTIWSGPAVGECMNDADWYNHVLNVTTYKNANFRIRFGYSIGQSGVFSVPGWSIDDVQLITGGCAASLTVKMYTEGYYAGNGFMDNGGAGGCLFVNGISGTTAVDADTVNVSAMNATTHILVNSQKAILKTNGNVSVNFPDALGGQSFFIKINHRNSIETWSSVPVLLTSTSVYDFTTAPTQAFGNNMRQTFDNLYWAFYSGDITDGINLGIQDGVIESSDYTEMENAVTGILTGYNYQDITGDGIAESADYSIMENNVGSIISVMKP